MESFLDANGGGPVISPVKFSKGEGVQAIFLKAIHLCLASRIVIPLKNIKPHSKKIRQNAKNQLFPVCLSENRRKGGFF